MRMSTIGSDIGTKDLRVGLATGDVNNGASDHRVGAGSEPALDAVAELVADGAE